MHERAIERAIEQTARSLTQIFTSLTSTENHHHLSRREDISFVSSTLSSFPRLQTISVVSMYQIFISFSTHMYSVRGLTRIFAVALTMEEN